MEQQNPYIQLDQEQCQVELDRLTELYWNAVDYVGSLATSRALVMNQMQDNMGSPAPVRKWDE